MVQPLTLATSVTKSRVYFCHARWNGRRHRISCCYRSLVALGDGRFQCKRCGKRFTDFTGSYLDRLRIPWNDLSHFLYLFVLGVPVYRFDLYTTISMKTAYKYYTLFRQAIYDDAVERVASTTLEGDIELDEAVFGGSRHGKRGWGAAGKVMVFGMYKRNGKVITFPIPTRQKDIVVPLVTRYSSPGSLYYTDNWTAYASLPVRGNHIIVKKEKGIPCGRDHINGIEGFWSFAKHWLYQYRGVPRSIIRSESKCDRIV